MHLQKLFDFLIESKKIWSKDIKFKYPLITRKRYSYSLQGNVIPILKGKKNKIKETHNGNPLQYSCLENPRDDGAWWAAVYGVVQSRTRLKRLSIALGEKSGLLVCGCEVERWSFQAMVTFFKADFLFYERACFTFYAHRLEKAGLW